MFCIVGVEYFNERISIGNFEVLRTSSWQDPDHDISNGPGPRNTFQVVFKTLYIYAFYK